MLQAIVHAANIQDRDGGAMLMATLFGLFPFLLKLYADGGYQGPEFRKALSGIFAQIDIEIVKRSDAAKKFVVLPRPFSVANDEMTVSLKLRRNVVLAKYADRIEQMYRE